MTRRTDAPGPNSGFGVGDLEIIRSASGSGNSIPENCLMSKLFCGISDGNDRSKSQRSAGRREFSIVTQRNGCVARCGLESIRERAKVDSSHSDQRVPHINQSPQTDVRISHRFPPPNKTIDIAKEVKFVQPTADSDSKRRGQDEQDKHDFKVNPVHHVNPVRSRFP